MFFTFPDKMVTFCVFFNVRTRPGPWGGARRTHIADRENSHRPSDIRACLLACCVSTTAYHPPTAKVERVESYREWVGPLGGACREREEATCPPKPAQQREREGRGERPGEKNQISIIINTYLLVV